MPKARRSESPSKNNDHLSQPVVDDDYGRFLSTLFADDSLPEDDNDDPDFLEDLKRMMEDLSDEELLVLPFLTLLLTPLQNPDGDGWMHDPHYAAADMPLSAAFARPTASIEASWLQQGWIRNSSVRSGGACGLGLDGYSLLSPARCTRSRLSMGDVDFAEIEGQPYQHLDGRDFVALHNKEGMDLLSMDQRPDQQNTVQDETLVKPLESFLRPNFRKPSSEFDEIFPYGMLKEETNDCFLPPLTQQRSVEILQIETVNGVVLVNSNAWTPNTILTLNKIINAHIQLLIQSHSACVGIPYMKKTCDEMHGMLHSLYHIFQIQSASEFPSDRMLTVEIPQLQNHRNAAKEVEIKKAKKRKSRKRRRGQVWATERCEEGVIDLTDESSDMTCDDPKLKASRISITVLDVPLMHLLPHLWQALTMVTMKTNGAFVTHYDRNRIEVSSQYKREKGLIASLCGARRIQKSLRIVQEFMTCGTKVSGQGTTKRGKLWSRGEILLMSYALRLYGTNLPFMTRFFLPSKDPTALLAATEKMKSLCIDLEWQRIEALLKDTESFCSSIADMEKRVVSAQDRLFAFCADTQRDAEKERAPYNLHTSDQDVDFIQSFQNKISDSTSQLMDKAQAIVTVPVQCTQSRAVSVRDGVCTMLEQFVKQISASADTIVAMSNLINSIDQSKQGRVSMNENAGPGPKNG